MHQMHCNLRKPVVIFCYWPSFGREITNIYRFGQTTASKLSKGINSLLKNWLTKPGIARKDKLDPKASTYGTSFLPWFRVSQPATKTYFENPFASFYNSQFVFSLFALMSSRAVFRNLKFKLEIVWSHWFWACLNYKTKERMWK